jgi:hypothetical protein
MGFSPPAVVLLSSEPCTNASPRCVSGAGAVGDCGVKEPRSLLFRHRLCATAEDERDAHLRLRLPEVRPYIPAFGEDLRTRIEEDQMPRMQEHAGATGVRRRLREDRQKELSLHSSRLARVPRSSGPFGGREQPVHFGDTPRQITLYIGVGPLRAGTNHPTSPRLGHASATPSKADVPLPGGGTPSECGPRRGPCSAKTPSTLPRLTSRPQPPDRWIMPSWILLALRDHPRFQALLEKYADDVEP